MGTSMCLGLGIAGELWRGGAVSVDCNAVGMNNLTNGIGLHVEMKDIAQVGFLCTSIYFF